MIFVAIFMDDIDEVVLGHICKSNMAIQVVGQKKSLWSHRRKLRHEE